MSLTLLQNFYVWLQILKKKRRAFQQIHPQKVCLFLMIMDRCFYGLKCVQGFTGSSIQLGKNVVCWCCFALIDTIQTEKPRHRSRRSSGSASSLLNSPDRRSTDSSRNSRHQASSGTGSPLNSPRGTDAPKSYRRHRSSNKSMDSPKGESSGTNRISRRQKNSSLGAESPTHDQPSIPKHSRGRKSKGSPGSGSSKSKEKKSSKEAVPFSDPGSGVCESINGRKNIASQLSSVLEAYEEEGWKQCSDLCVRDLM